MKLCLRQRLRRWLRSAEQEGRIVDRSPDIRWIDLQTVVERAVDLQPADSEG